MAVRQLEFQHETWSSRRAFLLATIGAAVGLGNLWRFPYMTGESGGGAFVLVYLLFMVLLCVPIMAGELAIGRHGHASAVGTMRKFVRDEGVSPVWQLIGWLSVLMPLVGLSFYSVVAGWSIDYVAKSAMNVFAEFDGEASGATFAHLLGSPLRLLAMQALFIAAAALVVGRGLGRGIEVIARFMMPTLFVLLLVLALNAVFNADISRGLRFLFSPDFSRITPAVAFMALGQAFFSVAVGVGMLITYGAYVPDTISLPKSALIIAIADTSVALLAGIAIFPVVFSYGLDPAGGPGLIFVTLPIAFGNMPAGQFVGMAFFVLLFFAAFTSAIGMLEPVVSWLEEHRGFSRPAMAACAALTSWILGIAATLSFSVWQDVRLVESIPMLEDKNIFDLLDFLVSNLLLPVNGLLIALFAGWAMSRRVALEELGLPDGPMFEYWRFTLKYVAPLAIVMIFVTSLTY